jgi:hypothetical protein
LPPGEQLLTLVSAMDKSKMEVRVSVEAGELVEIDEAFEKGTLTLQIVPTSGVQIWIDDVAYRGETNKPIELVSGEHVVRVKNSATGSGATKTVTVESGKETVIELAVE